MKTHIIFLLTLVLSCAATRGAEKIKVGGEVSLATLQKTDFIVGAAPTTWEPDKLYIIQCWATWCKPSVEALPRFSELAAAYKDKGLRLYGVNVWQKEKNKVVNFTVSRKAWFGYPTAFTGDEGVFISAWLDAAGVTDLPCAFVVKDGKLLCIAKPDALSNDVVAKLLAGGDEAAAVLQTFSAAENLNEALAKFKDRAFTLIEEKKFDIAQQELNDFVKTHDKLQEDATVELMMDVMIPYFVEKKDRNGAEKFLLDLKKKYPNSGLTQNIDDLIDQAKQQIDAKTTTNSPDKGGKGNEEETPK